MVDNDETVFIIKKDKSVVVISLNEYNSWQETEYLTRSSHNAKRLLEGVEQVKNGKISKQSLINE